jgi:hypothetical protein
MDGPPTAEAMAAHFGRAITAELSGETDVVLCSVRVWETPTSFAEFTPEEANACQMCKNSQ